MNNTNNHPMAEVKIQVRNGDGPWRDSIDFDPVMIPVETFDGWRRPAVTDVFSPVVIGLLDALIEADTMSDEPSPSLSYGLVWSDSEYAVKGICPVCDDFFLVADGSPGEDNDEPIEAVCCGCGS